MKSGLRFDQASLTFGGVKALSGVSLDIPPLGIYGIIGPNGAGKSTLFNLLTGLYKPDSGSIYLNDRPIQNLKTEEIARLGLARTFQNIRLSPHLSVLDHLRVVTAVEREGTFWQSFFGLAPARKLLANITQRAHALLELLDLAQLSQMPAMSLPYGKQRKLEIARALMRNPQLLLLDEPAAGMNALEKKALVAFLKTIQSQGIFILVIEHDMKFIMNLCQHVTALDQGKVCAQGTPAEVQAHPLVIESYLGSKA